MLPEKVKEDWEVFLEHVLDFVGKPESDVSDVTKEFLIENRYPIIKKVFNGVYEEFVEAGVWDTLMEQIKVLQEDGSLEILGDVVNEKTLAKNAVQFYNVYSKLSLTITGLKLFYNRFIELEKYASPVIIKAMFNIKDAKELFKSLLPIDYVDAKNTLKSTIESAEMLLKAAEMGKQVNNQLKEIYLSDTGFTPNHSNREDTYLNKEGTKPPEMSLDPAQRIPRKRRF